MFMKLIFVGSLALALFFTCFGIYFPIVANEARSWPETEGVIVKTGVRTHIYRGSLGTKSSKETHSVYYPEITYRWSVDGAEYEGDRYQLGTSHEEFKTKPEAREAAKAFPAGAAIPVFYDPDSPTEAVLVNRMSLATFVPLVLGVFMLVALGLAYRYREFFAAQQERQTVGAARRPIDGDQVGDTGTPL